jgi:hypothetical protein
MCPDVPRGKGDQVATLNLLSLMHLALILVLLTLLRAIVGSDDGVTPSSLEKCFDKTPCLALILIESYPAFTDKRMRIRSTWLQPAYQQPDLAFVFVVGILKSPDALLSQYQEWEATTFGDVKTINIQEDDLHILDRKAHGMFSWASGASGIDGEKKAAPRWNYLIKTDDDTVINPFQLRLFLLSPILSPRRERIYWGRSLIKKGWPIRLHLGMMYLISMDIAQVLQSMTYNEFESQLDPQYTLEDLRMAMFISSIVTQEEWLDALHCQLHDYAPDPQVQHTEYQYPLSNQTIVAHRVKLHHEFIAAFSSLLPIIEAMRSDCTDINDQRCQRWHVSQDQGCIVPPGLDLSPKDPPIEIHLRNSIISLLTVFSLTAAFVGGLLWLKSKSRGLKLTYL